MGVISKNKELVEEKRRQIADGAMRLFLKKGYSEPSMREIAEACGMSVGNIYNYIKSREQILYLALDYGNVAARAAIFVEFDLNDPVRALREAIACAVRNLDSVRDYVVFAYQETHNLPKNYRKRFLDTDKESSAMFHKIIEAGISNGVFRADINASVLAETIVVVAHMWCFRHWALRDVVTLDSYIEQQSDFILRALGAAGEGKLRTTDGDGTDRADATRAVAAILSNGDKDLAV